MDLARISQGAAVTLLVFAASCGMASSEPAARKPIHRSLPVSRIAPDVTGSLPAAQPAGAAAKLTAKLDDDEESLPRAFVLPSASRERMRECGEKWQRKKMSGDAGEEIWREFATECLPSQAAAKAP